MSTRIPLAGAVIVAAGLVSAPVNAQPASGPQRPINLVSPTTPRSHIAEPGTINVVSVGGEEISLRVQYPEMGGVLNVVGIYDSMKGGFFEPLAKAARAGNDDAARVLYDALDTCKQFPKTRAEYEAVIENGRKWFAETGGVPAEGGPPLDFDYWSQNIEAFFRKCEGVTDDMYTTATELVRASVDRGYDDNRFFYAQAIANTDPNEAHAQYEILWRQQGLLPALKLLGATSLPHRIAAIVAQGTLLGEPSKRDQLLSNLEASTSPSEFQEASKEAAQILKNPNCCRIFTN